MPYKCLIPWFRIRRFRVDWDASFRLDIPPFGRELLYFLRAQGLDTSIIDSLCAFDFSATKGIAFVHTIGGTHASDAW